MSNGKNTVSKSYGPESETDALTMPQSSLISETSTDNGQADIVEKWISSLEDFPVSHSLSLAKGKVNTTKGICGLTHSDPLAQYDHDSRCWRTSQACLLTNTYDEFSGTWPKSGMIVSGMLSERPTWARGTKDRDCLYWLPTPTTVCWKMKNYDPVKAAEYIKKHQNKAIIVIQGQLLEKYGTKRAMNPIAYEWMMGWPIMWTDLNALEMDGSFRSWLESFKLMVNNNG